ncbi:hypothetical protein [Frigoribacterium sp. MCBA15_019]|uniref:hypothetical protein n=1 Tax=unclassified Frigoribacterium TaxID=2627005 RepID=UPI0008DD636B|nr:hypothetical protein [Frigoribacterium sp. MCBA15_019]OII23838.1 hypothetical protein BIV04_07180 [Frigoribacterium sp. MCBA15_019]
MTDQTRPSGDHQGHDGPPPEEQQHQGQQHEGQQHEGQQTQGQGHEPAAAPAAFPYQGLPYGQQPEGQGQQPSGYGHQLYGSAPQPGDHGQPQGAYEQQHGAYGQPQGAYEQPHGAYGQPQEAPGQDAHGQPTQQFAYAQAPTPPAPRTPEQAARRRRLLIGLIGGAALLLVLVVAGAVTFATMSASHRPEATVRDYLGAVQAGEVERALALDGTEVADGDVLLTDDAYAAADDQVDGFQVGAVSTDGDDAQVEAVVHRADGSTHAQDFTLVRDGRDLLFFDRWALQPVDLGTVSVQVAGPASAEIAVDDTPVTRGSDGSVSLKAFPGSYEVALAGENESYSATAATAVVEGADVAAQPTLLTTTLTPAGTTAATAAVDAWVAGCIASTDLRPEGCSFGLYDTESGRYTLSGQKWTLESAPQFTVGDWQDGGWTVSTTTPGSASFTAQGVDAAGNSGVYGSLAPVPVRVGGLISDVTADGATFTSSVATPLT